MEKEYRKSLNIFFNQWLYCPGFPVLKISKVQTGKRKISLTIQQVQQEPVFQFPLQISIQNPSEKQKIKTLRITNANQTFRIRTGNPDSELIIDPNCHLLFQKTDN